MENDVRELLNQQINRELYSAYLYLDFSCFFEQSGLKGFAEWFRVQAKEELSHGSMFISYLTDSGENIVLHGIEEPIWSVDEEKNFKSILNAALKHEQYITHQIDTIYAHAEAAHDLRTMHFLDWFIGEQKEEEENAFDLIRQFTLYGHDPSARYLLDQELGKRKYTAPCIDE